MEFGNEIITASMPLAPQTVGSPGRGLTIEPIASLRRHPLFAIAAFLLTVVPGILFVKSKIKPKFSAETLVYVSPTFMKNLSEDNEQETQFFQYNTFIQHQVKSVTRYDVIVSALNALGKKRTLWQQPGEADSKAVERLQESIVVTRVPDTYQISIVLDGPKSEGLAEVVNSVAAAFVENARKEEFYGRPERLQKLAGEQERLTKLFEEKSARRTELTGQLGFVALPSGGPNPYDELLLRRKEELASARKARIDAEARLAAANAANQAGLHATAAEITSTDGGLASLKSSLNRRRSELLTQLSGLAPNTPLRNGAKQELAAIEAELERASSQLIQQTSSDVLERLRAELRRTQMVEARLKEDTDKLTAQGRQFGTTVRDASEIGLELEQIRNRINAVRNRSEYLLLESDAPGFVRIFSEARPPTRPGKDGSKKLMAMALAAALFAGVLLPVGVDFLDTRVRDVASVEKALGIPVLGMMIEQNGMNTQQARNHAMRLAVGLERAVQRSGARTFFFTGATQTSGTTFLTNAIGRELSQLGRRVLIIHANVQQAHIKEPFEFTAPGLVQLLRQELALHDVIGVGRSAGPTRIFLGQPGSGQNLPALSRMRDLLAAVSRQFDVVLVDGAPLLSSADAEYLAGVCDATVMVVRAGTTTRKHLDDVGGLLKKLNPANVGLILTRVATKPAPRKPAVVSASSTLSIFSEQRLNTNT